MSDLSGLSYSAATGTLFAVYDKYDLVEERPKLTARCLQAATMPAGSWKYDPLNDSCPTSTSATVVLLQTTPVALLLHTAATLRHVLWWTPTVTARTATRTATTRDAAVSTIQTYFRDQDRDTYGDAATTTSLCSATLPYGYVANDDDAYPNNKIEIYGDGVDNDGDMYVDENNTLGETDAPDVRQRHERVDDNGRCNVY